MSRKSSSRLPVGLAFALILGFAAVAGGQPADSPPGADADADAVTKVGYLFNRPVYGPIPDPPPRAPGEADGDKADGRRFSNSWALWGADLERIVLDVSAVPDAAKEHVDGGVKITGRFVEGRLIVAAIVADEAGDQIRATGRVVFDGLKVGIGGETDPSTWLVVPAADGRPARKIAVDASPTIFGREVVATGTPFLTRPGVETGIQAMVLRLTSIEPTQPTPGSGAQILVRDGVLLGSTDAGYELVTANGFGRIPVAVGLVAEAARQAAGRRVVGAVAVARDKTGELVYHLAGIGPMDYAPDGYRPIQPIGIDFAGFVLPGQTADGEDPDAGTPVSRRVLTSDGRLLTVSGDAAFLDNPRIIGMPVGFRGDWTPPQPAEGDRPAQPEQLTVNGVMPYVPVMRRSRRAVFVGRLLELPVPPAAEPEAEGDDGAAVKPRFVLVTIGGEVVPVSIWTGDDHDAQRLAAARAAAESGLEAQLFGQLPRLRGGAMAPDAAISAYEITVRPAAGPLQWVGRAAEADGDAILVIDTFFGTNRLPVQFDGDEAAAAFSAARDADARIAVTGDVVVSGNGTGATLTAASVRRLATVAK
jgi:hypothetical protein